MNNIDDLRAHLFDAMKSLKDGTMDVERAKAMAETAQVIINSAKVEVDFLRVNGGVGTGFIPEQKALPGQPRLVKGVR